MTSILPITLTGAEVRRKGRTILGPVNLTLEGQGLTIVLGPNGAGKTTLLKALHGLERLSSGRLSQNLPPEAARTRQAYVFQIPIVLRRSLRQNLAYPLQLQGVAKAEIAERVEAWAARIGLDHLLDSQATRLSGGERQKLALARALISGPDLLFLDEPCAYLDGRSTREIEAILTEARDAGTRIVMATHDLGQARRLATEAIFVLGGKIHDRGPAPGFFANPNRPETRAYFDGDIIE